MTPFKTFAVGLLPAALTLGILAHDAAAQTPAPLPVQVYNADAGSFHVNAVLVSGQTDAVLIDTGFTRADALRIASMVLDSKKTLKTVYISQADPDYQFGIEVIKQFFPQAQVVATAPTLEKIEATRATKLQVWGPRMGANAPRSVPLPTVLTGHSLPGQVQDSTQRAWSRAYLARFEQELPRAANSGALIDAMKRAYPNAGLGIALDIGAKVNKGEMTW